MMKMKKMLLTQKNHSSMTDFLIPSHQLSSLVSAWLAEDIPSFDYAGAVVGDKPASALLYCKGDGVVAGVPFVNEVFRQLHCTIEWLVDEGTVIALAPGERKRVCAVVRGAAHQLLAGERTALNVLARASGLATRAREAAQIATRVGWRGRVAGTRKTTPGFRLVEKHALLVGGCDAHRMDLSSMIMLKDNHINSAGNIAAAVRHAKRVGGFALKVEVETSTLADALDACRAGADVVMLDNYAPDALRAVAAQIRADPAARHVLLEASGGITLDTLERYMCADVDVISLGSLTQGVAHVDFSLKIEKAPEARVFVGASQ
jgi:nicotinate-nucleotide pyrophosphorylase (carboxylating)